MLYCLSYLRRTALLVLEYSAEEPCHASMS